MSDQPDTSGEHVDPAAAAIPLAGSPGVRYVLARRGRGPCRRMPAIERLMLLAAGVALLTLLVVARCLSPDPSGHGTHRQLGLPPCTFVALFGKTCPSCGMTTAWAHVMRGQLGQATRANTGGTILGLTAVIASPWLLLSAAFGRWLIARPSASGLVVYAFALAAIVMTDWWIKTGGWL